MSDAHGHASVRGLQFYYSRSFSVFRACRSLAMSRGVEMTKLSMVAVRVGRMRPAWLTSSLSTPSKMSPSGMWVRTHLAFYVCPVFLACELVTNLRFAYLFHGVPQLSHDLYLPPIVNTHYRTHAREELYHPSWTPHHPFCRFRVVRHSTGETLFETVGDFIYEVCSLAPTLFSPSRVLGSAHIGTIHVPAA